MKLKFKNQEFQTDAANSIVDLFRGQEKLSSTFEISEGPQLALFENELGIGNIINISKEELLQNMHEIQKRNNLPLTDDITDENGAMRLSFSVEMETGTGKT